MTLKGIKMEKCRDCSLRIESGCPIEASCPTDVIRLDKAGLPANVYPDDCMSCFLCELDCPNGAVEVGAEVPLTLLPSY